MRMLIKKVASASNLSFIRLSAIRFSSSDANTKSQEKESPKPELEEAAVKKNISVEKYGGVMTLNIDRQATRNSLDEPTLREMAAAIDAFDKDAEAKVLVFNGEGGSFCSGFDMDEMSEKGYYALKDAASRLLRRPLCDKPTIAAVTGFAVAEGFELALACDLRVIEDTAVMGFLGRRFGVPSTLYGGRRLTSLIGLSQALDLLMTGRLISGTEAHQKGLAAKVTTTGTGNVKTSLIGLSQALDLLITGRLISGTEAKDLLAKIMATGTALGESIKLAKSIAKFPQNALMMDKLAAVNSQLNPNSEESMRDEAVMQSLLGAALEDLKEGVKKFQDGVGKHGKFHNLTEVSVEDWELENTVEETVVTHDGDKKK